MPLLISTSKLVEMFSATSFNQYVSGHVGKYVKRGKLLQEFEKDFGKGSRSYLSLRCKKIQGTSLLTEIHLYL